MSVITARDQDRVELERRARHKAEPARVTRRDQIILLIVEAVGSRPALVPLLTALLDTTGGRREQPLCPGTPWADDIGHGEMVRTMNAQTLAISPCQMQYLYQGINPSTGGGHNTLPWRLDLLTLLAS